MVVRAVPVTSAPMVRVYALKAHVQRNITHRPTGYKFNAEGWSVWPMDQFTKRRMRDGDISLEPPQQQPQGATQEGQPQSGQRRRIEAPKQESSS